MRKISILFTLLLSFGISAQEVFVLQPVNIDPSDTQKFEMIEKTYATPMAQEAKEKGLIKDWYLMKKSWGGRATEKALYIWVHVYESIDQMSNAGNWWETKDKFGVAAAEIYDGVTRYPVGNFMYKTEKSYETDRAGKFVIFNWAAPSDMGKMISLADKISSSFKGNMKKSGMTSWGMATRVYPQGEEFDPLFFWDGYETRAQALAHLMNQGVLDVVKPEMFAELFKLIPNGFSNRVIMEAVTGTY
ncbi:MAG: hypothetical protein VW979_01510 [Flavobacteriaceae bacterium]